MSIYFVEEAVGYGFVYSPPFFFWRCQLQVSSSCIHTQAHPSTHTQITVLVRSAKRREKKSIVGGAIIVHSLRSGYSFSCVCFALSSLLLASRPEFLLTLVFREEMFIFLVDIIILFISKLPCAPGLKDVRCVRPCLVAAFFHIHTSEDIRSLIRRRSTG